jgi:hypothetical protein
MSKTTKGGYGGLAPQPHYYICGLCEREFRLMSAYKKHSRMDHPIIDHRDVQTKGQIKDFIKEYKGLMVGNKTASFGPYPLTIEDIEGKNN